MTNSSWVEVSSHGYLTRPSTSKNPSYSRIPHFRPRFPPLRGWARPICIGTYGTHGSLNNGPFLTSLGKEHGSVTQFAGRLPGLRLENRRGPLGAGFAHRALALRGSVDLVSPQGIRPCDHPGGHRAADPRLCWSSPWAHEVDHGVVVRHPGGSDRNLCDHPRFTVARVPFGATAGDLLPRSVPRVQRYPTRERAVQELALPVVHRRIASELNSGRTRSPGIRVTLACGQVGKIRARTPLAVEPAKSRSRGSSGSSRVESCPHTCSPSEAAPVPGCPSPRNPPRSARGASLRTCDGNRPRYRSGP